MLGRTASDLFWMFRYLERCENMARLIEVGFHISLTRAQSANDEWNSILQAAGLQASIDLDDVEHETRAIINFLLRDKDNPSSVRSLITAARQGARSARTALTRSVWEAVNDAWILINDALAKPVQIKDLPPLLSMIKQQTACVHGCLQTSMLRNDVMWFSKLGTHIERANSTARILDVKYYMLLPSVSQVGGPIDTMQWETILRSVSGERAYRWAYKEDTSAYGIAKFLILEPSMPRSLIFCQDMIAGNLSKLSTAYGDKLPSEALANDIQQKLKSCTVESIFETGLHEFIGDFILNNQSLSTQIEQDYRFYP